MERQSVVTTIGGILGSAILAAVGYTGSTITELSTRIGALEQQTTTLETTWQICNNRMENLNQRVDFVYGSSKPPMVNLK